MFSLDLFRLDGRRALVTGGASGIGAAVAAAVAAAGADVAVTSHTRPADPVLTTIAGLGRKGIAIPADLADLDTAKAAEILAKAAAGLGGPIDILINNAGIIRRADAMTHSETDWRDVMATNLDAVWRLSQAAAPGMAALGRGRIINIGSILSFQGGVRVPGYTAAKHAVLGLTKALANEWAPKGITVNAIAPGYVATENTRPLREDPVRVKELLSRIPSGRFAEPDDICGAAVFLASNAASYVTGAVLAVDGGWLSR